MGLAILVLHIIMCTIRALQVDRLQRRRGIGSWGRHGDTMRALQAATQDQIKAPGSQCEGTTIKDICLLRNNYPHS